MPTTDPRTTITTTIVDHLGDLGPILNDIGGATTILIQWEGSTETFKYLFNSVAAGGLNYDAVITIGEPRSRADRPIQDVPVHFLMRYPVTVTTVNKPLTGLPIVSTAARMQYKITYALRNAITVDAQSAVGVPPAYTMKLVEDVATRKRIAGLGVWQAVHYVEYTTDYG